MNCSTILDHNKFQQTDRLYDPLRSFVITHHFHNEREVNTQNLNSSVSNYYRVLSENQVDKIIHNTYIPIDAKLKPTHNLDKIAHCKLVAISTQERIIGDPLTESQLIRTLEKSRRGEEKIVYQFDNAIENKGIKLNIKKYGKYEDKIQERPRILSQMDKNAESRIFATDRMAQTKPMEIDYEKKQQKKLNWLRIDENEEELAQNQSQKADSTVHQMNKIRSSKSVRQIRPLRSKNLNQKQEKDLISKYQPLPLSQQKKKQESKYNIYSMIDEPVNKIRQNGCRNIKCPSNECIASKTLQRSVAWLK